MNFLEKVFLRSRKISSEREVSDQVKLFFSDTNGKVTIRFDITGATQYYDLNRSEIEGLAKELLNFLDKKLAN